jgi:hypothetical protein
MLVSGSGQFLNRRTLLRGIPVPLHTATVPQNEGATIVLQWNNATLQAIRTLCPAVTVVARALAMVHTSMYDAWAAYAPVACGTRYGGALRQPARQCTEANKLEAVSYAAYRTLVQLFPEQAAYFNDVMTQSGYDPTSTTIGLTKPAHIGNVAALGVLNQRRYDGANQAGDASPGAYSDYTHYTPVNEPDHIHNPNRWQPLRVSDGKGGWVIQNCVTPQWRHVKPFALTSSAQLRLEAAARYPGDLYYNQAQQILSYSANLNDVQKVIVEYWQNGPDSEQPPGHWCVHAQYIVRRNGYDLDQTVKLFFILTNGLCDASIACWDTKLAYTTERPITAIRYLFKGCQVQAWAGPHKGKGTIAGESWLPYQPPTLVTHAAPEHCSSHSAFSAVSAALLRRFTGSDYFGASYTKKAGSSDIERGTVPAKDTVLHWRTFSEAAIQAGLSQRYGGVQFALGDIAGRTLGQQVADVVWQKAQNYIQGRF